MPRVRRAVTLADESRILATPDMATTKLGLYFGHLQFNAFRVYFALQYIPPKFLVGSRI
jgi:hypothetical protein